MKFKDLSGQIFGKLTVISRADDKITPSGQHKTCWHCKCVCGKEIIVMATHLNSGHTTQCHNCSIKQRVKKIIKTNRYDITGSYGIGWTSNTGKEFYFDLEDYDKIKDYTWREHETNNGSYIVSLTPHIFLHRLIMSASQNKVIDYIDHNTFDCRKSNLRECTIAENNYNKVPKNKEVCGILQNLKGKWTARITYKGQIFHLGTFNTKKEAIKARKEAEKKYYGEYRYQVN